MLSRFSRSVYCITKQQFPNAFILLGGDFNCPGINWSDGTLLESYLPAATREALLQFTWKDRVM